MEGWKYRSGELSKAICHQKNIKNADSLCMKFSSTFNASMQRCLYPLFRNQRPHFLLLHHFRRLSQPSGQDYHPSPTEFTSRIHPLIFLWTPKGFISPECFLNYFPNLYISPWLQICFKFMMLRLMENKFLRQKIESVHFSSWPQAKLSSRFLSPPNQTEGNYPFPPNKVFWKSISPAERGRTMELKIWPKLNLQWYLSQVLINSTICSFNIFGFCFFCSII